jgi:hypothetical protein
MGVPAPKFSGELERIISGASGVYAYEEGFETFHANGYKILRDERDAKILGYAGCLFIYLFINHTLTEA